MVVDYITVYNIEGSLARMWMEVSEQIASSASVSQLVALRILCSQERVAERGLNWADNLPVFYNKEHRVHEKTINFNY